MDTESSSEDEEPVRKVSTRSQKSKNEDETEKKVKTTPQEEGEAKVSGLSFDASQDDIWNWFQETAGVEVTNVKLLSMPNGRSKGIAFVKVGNRTDLEKVLALHKMEHMGRWLNVEESFGAPARDNNGQKSFTQQGYNQDNANKKSNTIFVGNVSFNCTEDSLRGAFESIGNINQVRIAMRDGQPRGFAHVEFFDENSAQEACKLAGTMVDGRPIRIDISE